MDAKAGGQQQPNDAQQQWDKQQTQFKGILKSFAQVELVITNEKSISYNYRSSCRRTRRIFK